MSTNTQKKTNNYDEIIYTKDDSDWLLARDDYYQRLGKDTVVKTISDFKFGVSFLLTNATRNVIIVVNDRVLTGYKGKKLYRSKV